MKKVALVIVVAVIIYLAVSMYGAKIAIEISRRPLGDSPASVGLTYEDVSFPSRVDHVMLRGWYIAGGEFNIIVVNGGHQNRVDPEAGTLELTKDLFLAGYSVLLFDFRGRGESEGEGLVMMDFKHDIGGAVDYLVSRGCPTSSICLLGFSTGATESMLFATTNDVAAIVPDSSFANTVDMFVREAASQKGWPKPVIWFFTPGILLMARLIYGFELVNPLDKVADVGCPILFIHGAADDRIPPTNSEQLHQASTNPANELWIVPGAEHCQAYNTDRVGYLDRVTNFFGDCEIVKEK